MDPKFERYSSTLDALAREAIACMPEGWDAGTLAIACDGFEMRYALKNGEAPDKARLSGELRTLCESLYVVMREGGDAWTGASVHLVREANQWSFTADFDSPPPSTRPSAYA